MGLMLFSLLGYPNRIIEIFFMNAYVCVEGKSFAMVHKASVMN